MASTGLFLLFLCLAVLSSMALTQGAPSGESLQLQATPLRGKVAPRDDSSDPVLRRVKRNNFIYFTPVQEPEIVYVYFRTAKVYPVPKRNEDPKPKEAPKYGLRGYGLVMPPCDKFGCRSSRREGRDRNLATCESGFRFDRRSRTCRRLVGSG